MPSKFVSKKTQKYLELEEEIYNFVSVYNDATSYFNIKSKINYDIVIELVGEGMCLNLKISTLEKILWFLKQNSIETEYKLENLKKNHIPFVNKD